MPLQITLHIIVMHVCMYILYKALTWLRISNCKTTQLLSVFIIILMRFLFKINVNKHDTISSLFVRLEIEPTTTMCYYAPYDIIFQPYLLTFHLSWGNSKRFLFSWKDNVFTIYVFVVLPYLDISKTTHRSKKLRQLIMTCFL